MIKECKVRETGTCSNSIRLRKKSGKECTDSSDLPVSAGTTASKTATAKAAKATAAAAT